MIEGDAQAASQEKAEEKGEFIRGSTPVSPSHPRFFSLSRGRVHTVPLSFSIFSSSLICAAILS